MRSRYPADRPTETNTQHDEALRAVFLAAVGTGAGTDVLRARTDLAATLGRLLAEAKSAWPDVADSPALESNYMRHLAARMAGVEEGRPERLCTRDLYLTCACAGGDLRAIASFERHCMRHVDAAVAHLHLDPSDVDETKQILRDRLFVGESDSLPRIAAYAGRGELARWVRLAAVRTALRVMRKPKAEVEIDADILAALPSPAEDLDLDYLKRKYRADFRAAVLDGFCRLPEAKRVLLRESFRHGLGLDELASLYRVHRATIARRLVDARADLATGARDSLMKRLGVGRTEASTIAELVYADICVDDMLLSGERAGSADRSGSGS